MSNQNKVKTTSTTLPINGTFIQSEDPELVSYVEFVHGFRMKERGDRMMTALTEDDVDEMRAVPGGVLIQRNGRCYMVWGQNIKFAELKAPPVF